jgi:hypothetical protein
VTWSLERHLRGTSYATLSTLTQSRVRRARRGATGSCFRVSVPLMFHNLYLFYKSLIVLNQTVRNLSLICPAKTLLLRAKPCVQRVTSRAIERHLAPAERATQCCT